MNPPPEFLVDLIAEHLHNAGRQAGENWWRATPVTPATRAMFRRRAVAVIDAVVSAGLVEEQWRVTGVPSDGAPYEHPFIGLNAEHRARAFCGLVTHTLGPHAWIEPPTVKRRYVIRTPWAADDE